MLRRCLSLALMLAFAAALGCSESKKESARKSAPAPAKDGPPRDIDFGDKAKSDEMNRKELSVLAKDQKGVGVVNSPEAAPAKDGTAGGGGEPKPKADPKKAPAVWKRDAARPTFARVYVGDGNALELVSLQVSVQIDGARARTLVDHVFRNPHDRQLEGTFEYPLPAGASPSYYAMFLGAARADTPPRRFPPGQAGKPPLVPEMLAPAMLARQVDIADWGKLQEARVVSPEKAAEAYEETTRQRIDPALLEYASGNTFRGRVFPIAPKGYNRVLVAYEETLPVVDGRLSYRYALPGVKLHEMRVGLSADPAQMSEPTFAPKEARKDSSDSRIGFDHAWSDAKPEGDIVFTAKPKDPGIQAASGRQGDKGPYYLHARVRPELAKLATPEPFARHAVFLLDTSLSADRDRFDVQMKLLQAILAKDSQIEQFNVVCFNAAAVWLHPRGWLPNTKEGRDKALASLDGILLEGATDLGAALDKLAAPPFPFAKGTPVAAFVLSDGHLTWGETDPAPLVARFRASANNPARFFCYRTGLGQENAELYEALTREGGGVFQCYGAAEVEAAAQAHRSECLQVKSVTLDGGSEVLVSGRRAAVYPGGELVVVGQFAKPGKARVTVKGTFGGKAFEQVFDAEVADGGEMAGRAWGEVAVASLLSLNDPWTEGLVTAYCQQFGIASRAASFLVLENEAEYKRFDIEEQKKEAVKGDVGRYLEDAWASLGKEPSRKQALGKLIYLIDAKTKALTGPAGENLRKMLELVDEKDCALPLSSLNGAIRFEKDAPAAYLAGRKKDPRDIAPHLDEAQRRLNDGDADGAAIALSSILEEHSGRGDALRLVGYRLLDMRQPGAAAGLFARVLKQRPYEPHSWRDLARSLEDAGRYPLAALLNEAVLAGTWHERFGGSLKLVMQEEHSRLLRAAIKDGNLNDKQRAFFATRLSSLGDSPKAALRVSITWNTDGTDIDLHVVEPDGTKVMYNSPNSKNGGRLSQDLTQGYGPERYHTPSALRGEYRILVHYFRANPNLIGGETHVGVTITRDAGTDKEKTERKTVILKRGGELAEVARLRY